jgi:hypothetical protein
MYRWECSTQFIQYQYHELEWLVIIMQKYKAQLNHISKCSV